MSYACAAANDARRAHARIMYKLNVELQCTALLWCDIAIVAGLVAGEAGRPGMGAGV